MIEKDFEIWVPLTEVVGGYEFRNKGEQVLL